MKSKILVCWCRLFLVVGVVAAIPSISHAAPPPAAVTIKIHRQPQLRLQVGPRGVGACKKPGADCASSVIWKAGHGATGPRSGEYILIRYKSTACGSQACFGQSVYRIDAANTEVSSGPVSAGCSTPTVWFYSVELWGDAGTPGNTSDDHQLCPAVDPGVIIDTQGFLGP